MSIKTRRRISWAMVIVLIVFGSLAFRGEWRHSVFTYLPGVEVMLLDYIKANDGRFPDGLEELIEKGHVEVGDGGFFSTEYSTLPVEVNEIRMQSPLDNYDILYGVDVDDLVECDGKLYDRLTGKQVLLVSGWFKRTTFEPHTGDEVSYNATSLRLYAEMCRQREMVDGPSGGE